LGSRVSRLNDRHEAIAAVTAKYVIFEGRDHTMQVISLSGYGLGARHRPPGTHLPILIFWFLNGASI
ncbi:hypothetical protein, partial [Acetobacter aceti]|uniref:hypothetical protein n=1 Tax=Acetobacter aceti TaxID=435 RepID=UPI001C60BC94